MPSAATLAHSMPGAEAACHVRPGWIDNGGRVGMVPIATSVVIFAFGAQHQRTCSDEFGRIPIPRRSAAEDAEAAVREDDARFASLRSTSW